MSFKIGVTIGIFEHYRQILLQSSLRANQNYVYEYY